MLYLSNLLKATKIIIWLGFLEPKKKKKEEKTYKIEF
jgi:hypothetical protein